jgi:hypothetical protein
MFTLSNPAFAYRYTTEASSYTLPPPTRKTIPPVTRFPGPGGGFGPGGGGGGGGTDTPECDNARAKATEEAAQAECDAKRAECEALDGDHTFICMQDIKGDCTYSTASSCTKIDPPIKL